MGSFRSISMTAILGGVLVVACSAQATPTAKPAAPTAYSTQPAATTAPATAASAPTKPAAAKSPTAGLSAKLDMNAIFPPGPGREAALNNCTTCHTFVPLVVLQMSQTQWEVNALGHRDRVPGMSDADYKAAYAYLSANFNPDHPVPVLPPELLTFWTDY